MKSTEEYRKECEDRYWAALGICLMWSREERNREIEHYRRLYGDEMTEKLKAEVKRQWPNRTVRKL